MGILPIGSVVFVNFPYADLSSYKKRPAVVIARGSLSSVVLCQITSRALPGIAHIVITKPDFAIGSLILDSYVRPDKLFTVDEKLAGKQIVGRLTAKKSREIRTKIRELFT